MMQRHEFHAMGCRMLAGLDSDSVPAALYETQAWFEAWEQCLSRFRYDSELSRLNLKSGVPVVVSDALWNVFQVALRAYELTDGLVNALVLDALIQAGYDRSFDTLAARESFVEDLAEARLSALTDVILDPDQRTMQLPAGAHLDFGGVAKGWCAHQAVQALAVHGPSLFSAGGDIALSGSQRDGTPWPISVDDPFRPGEFTEMLYLPGGGVATSGRDYRRWKRDHHTLHHIIDPRTSLPAETDILTATVIAPDVMTAEALAKAVLISGSERGLAWLDGDPELAGLLILEDGRKLYSKMMEEYL